MTNSNPDRLEGFTNYAIYDQDFNLWIDKTISLLKEGQFHELDIPNLIEEIQTLGTSEKHALQSNLIVVLLHLLKYKYQPTHRSNSWLSSIAEHRDRLDITLADSPSLQTYLDMVLLKSYERARRRATIETGLPINTFPSVSPFTPEQALDPFYLPE